MDMNKRAEFHVDDDNDYVDDHDQPVKALDALVGLVVELAVHRLVVLVHHLERVRAISDQRNDFFFSLQLSLFNCTRS